MSKQLNLTETYEFETREPIKGFPELRWTGKRPYKSTQYYPAQLREQYGVASDCGWLNKIFWGDNLQVMSHMMRNFRGKIDLIYIDPPFDSKADYKKKITLHGKNATNDSTSFEEKQYSDIWTNDEYLQFMYERLILLRELLSDTGQILVHLDYHKCHHIRLVMDEIFGQNNFRNELIWTYNGGALPPNDWPRKHDNLLRYVKTTKEWTFNTEYRPYNELTAKRMKSIHKGVQVDVERGTPVTDWWTDIKVPTGPMNKEKSGYPTQKPIALLERIINALTNPGDLVFDCFMGSGTTQAVAMKLGRRFIGADINLGAIHTTTKRLIGIADELSQVKISDETTKYTGFEVYNVNDYDFFRNPVEARNLLIEALGIQPFPQSELWDGELDGRMVKIMPVERIATKADLEIIKANMPYDTYDKRQDENPAQIIERITLVCMGHEPDLKAALERELSKYRIDIQVRDILKDRAELRLKREAEAEVVREGSKLIIRQFYPRNLMQKLSLQEDNFVDDWRELVESVMVDWNFDGAIMNPTVTDILDKKSLVSGIYDIPANAGTIKVKITDLLSETLEVEVK